jgi:hypothetical protein
MKSGKNRSRECAAVGEHASFGGKAAVVHIAALLGLKLLLHCLREMCDVIGGNVSDVGLQAGHHGRRRIGSEHPVHGGNDSRLTSIC